ncbi:MAG: hypothetical protein H7837_09765 [Magnetococcus sp. MYC-9]
MRSTPHHAAKQWLEKCRVEYDSFGDLVWCNLVLEKNYGFISDNLWLMVCRFLGKAPQALMTAHASDVLYGVVANLPLLALLGPMVLEEVIPAEQGALTMVSVVPAFRFKGMFDIAGTYVTEIESAVKFLSDAAESGKPAGEIHRLAERLDHLVRELNETIGRAYSQGSVTTDDTRVARRGRTKRRQEAYAGRLPELMRLIGGGPSAVVSPVVPEGSDVTADVRWVSPDHVLVHQLQAEGASLPSQEAMERAIQMLGLQPYLEPDDDTVPDCRFLIRFEVDSEYRALVRKPTMFSGGFPRIYATYKTAEKEQHDRVQGYGCTVDLKSRDAGLQEAVVPNALVAATADRIQLVGVLPPSRVLRILASLDGTEFVKTVAHKRLALLGVNNLDEIGKHQMERDACHACSSKCYQ